MQVKDANVERVDFSVSLVLFWVKGYISVDNRMIKTMTKNTMAGIIPLGEDEQVFKLDNVQGSSTSSAYKLSSFVWGVIWAFVGFSMLDSSTFTGLLILIFGIVTFLNGIRTSITIQGNGSNYSISVPFFEKSNVQHINNAIHQSLLYSQDAHDINRLMANTNQNTEAIVEAIKTQN